MIRKRYVSANKLEAQMIGEISNEERLMELEVIRDAMLHVDNPKERWDLADSFMLILKDLIGQWTPQGRRNETFYQAKNAMYELAEHGKPGNATDSHLAALDGAMQNVKNALMTEAEPA